MNNQQEERMPDNPPPLAQSLADLLRAVGMDEDAITDRLAETEHRRDVENTADAIQWRRPRHT